MKKIYIKNLFIIIIACLGGFVISILFLQNNLKNIEPPKVIINEKKYIEESQLIAAIEKTFNFSVTIKNQDSQILGSGFILNAKGEIMTTRHVVSDNTQKYLICFSDNSCTKAEVKNFDNLNDIASLQINDISQIDQKFLQNITISKNNDLKLGQIIFSIGYNGNFTNSISKGIISGLNRNLTASFENGYRSEELKNLIQLDMNISQGMSGSPIFNLNSELIGMIVAVAKDQNGVGFGIPKKLFINI
ncbi:MAG: serine protease Do [Candidatus Peregrinibacteria bacterium GW2011_GWF2_33_10]|nr:MAG: serine protease Do [Candidatus Peregrinibacteria bacterium GW2011_GWF2_33_10]OGJ43959.1 MAG: hypothetical protein A2272_05030 [Candidatus Peregrinibacteria bacterium RIFOXYA12_FULL_33_12]OGJ44599.1 MAG: hypothetical protein A2263_06525 [Candidatus Peregrinibacteria bacterium RIFOXYA2_FULL_33_21]OGJ50342.1 MAG: hypothetical protein A2307_01675 [Candidatus Peregrinibacteria bacterium RIFOXYB2_FULL_33_20]